MDGPGSRLAARFRKAVQDRDEARREAEDSAKRAQEEGRIARAQLLKDLAALAQDIGVLRVAREGEGLTLRFGERYLHFEPMGDHDRVRVEFEGSGDEEHALFRQAELGNRWVYGRQRRLREDRVPLFDAGLEDLLVRGLGLPKPGDDPGPQPSPPSAKKL